MALKAGYRGIKKYIADKLNRMNPGDSFATDAEIAAAAQQIYKDTGVLGAKNLNATKYISGTGAFDVEFTQMDDGGINVSGSIASDTDISDMSVETFIAKRSEAVIASANSTSPKLVAFLYDVTTSSRATIDITFGEVTTNLIKGHVYRFRVRAVGVCALDNDKIYPMLRLASDTDPTYQPYVETNYELTNNKADYSIIGNVEKAASSAHAYTAGQGFICDGQYRVAKGDGISIGDEITNSNSDVKPISQILTDLKIKTETFSGITTANGNVLIYSGTDRKVLSVDVGGSAIATVYYSTDGVRIRVISTTLTDGAEVPLINTAVEGTYYYI